MQVVQSKAIARRVAAGPISLPAAVSHRSGSKTPLVDKLVRRSSHLNPDVIEGVQVVNVREPAFKRRKRGLSVNLDNPSKNADEAVEPVPLDVLLEWATRCGVAPMELSEETLMQGHQDDQE